MSDKPQEALKGNFLWAFPLPLGEGQGEGLATQPTFSFSSLIYTTKNMEMNSYASLLRPHPSPLPKGEGASIRFPTQRLRFVVHTHRPDLFIHDQKRAEPVKVILISLARKVISEIADVGSFADVSEISHAVGDYRQFREHPVVTLDVSSQLPSRPPLSTT